MSKVRKVILNEQFEYRKEISAEKYYTLIEKYCNQRNKSLQYRLFLSYFRTPFYERNKDEYSFSIGSKINSLKNQIYGCIEDLGSYSNVKIRIEPPFYARIIAYMLIFLFASFFFQGTLMLIVFLMFLTLAWDIIAILFLINLFERIIQHIPDQNTSDG